MYPKLVVTALVFALSAQAFAQEIRPYDDSDPDMKALMDQFLDLTPCGPDANGLCPEALGMLTGGGDRLAAYLIHQLSLPEPATGQLGYPSYLRLLGHTESETGFQYLAALVATRADALAAEPGGDQYPLISAVEGLGRTRDLRTVPIMLNLLDRFGDQPDVMLRAVNAADRIQSKHGPQPEVGSRLAALKAQSTPSLAIEGAEETPIPPPNDGQSALAARVDAVLAQPGKTGP